MAMDATIYQGISDAQVEELRWQIQRNMHAVEAARTLLVHANLCIAAGLAMPEKLRNFLGDGLHHLEANDPLSAFGHVRPPARGRGRPAKESNREWVYVMKGILEVHKEGFPLAHESEGRYPFKKPGSAFEEYARRHNEGNSTALRKEARRLQAGFWKHIRGLPFAQIESLGLDCYLPRKKS